MWCFCVVCVCVCLCMHVCLHLHVCVCVRQKVTTETWKEAKELAQPKATYQICDGVGMTCECSHNSQSVQINDWHREVLKHHRQHFTDTQEEDNMLPLRSHHLYLTQMEDNMLPLHSHHLYLTCYHYSHTSYLTQMEDMLLLHSHQLYLTTCYHYIHTTVTWHRWKTTCYSYIHPTFTWHMRKTTFFNICLYLFSPRLSLISTQIFWLNSLDKIQLFYL